MSNSFILKSLIESFFLLIYLKLDLLREGKISNNSRFKPIENHSLQKLSMRLHWFTNDRFREERRLVITILNLI